MSLSITSKLGTPGTMSIMAHEDTLAFGCGVARLLVATMEGIKHK